MQFDNGNAAYSVKKNKVRNFIYQNKNGKEDNFTLIICISLVVAPTNL